MIRSLALIGGPLLCGVVFFLLAAPAQAPGVYVEIGDGLNRNEIADGLYRLSTCIDGASDVDVSGTAPVAPGGVSSFFLVLPDTVAARTPAPSARLYLRVANHAAPRIDYGRAPIGATVGRMAPRVYRVTSDQALRWDAPGATSSFYWQALSRLGGNRETTELLVELEITTPLAACRYAVTLGPPAGLRHLNEKWFQLAPDRRP